MAADPRAEQKREAAITTAVALVAVYGAAKANVMARVARGVREGLLLPYWLGRIETVNAKALKRIAADAARSVSDRVSIPRMDAYLEVGAHARAEAWMDNTQAILADIDKRAEDIARRVEAAMDKQLTQAPKDAQDLADHATDFGLIEGEKANGKATKTWHLGTVGNHRASHEALNGETVPIENMFSNGLAYPHAPGPPSETENCKCWLSFGGDGDA